MKRERANIWHSLPAAQTPTVSDSSCSTAGSEAAGQHAYRGRRSEPRNDRSHHRGPGHHHFGDSDPADDLGSAAPRGRPWGQQVSQHECRRFCARRPRLGSPGFRPRGALRRVTKYISARQEAAKSLRWSESSQLDRGADRNLCITSDKNARTVSESSAVASRLPELNEAMAAETSGAKPPATGNVRSAASTLAYQRRSRAKLKARQPLRTALSRRCPSCGSLWASTEAITIRRRSSKGNSAKSCGGVGPYSGVPL